MDVFSNDKYDDNALFHAPRYFLFAHHSSNSQTALNRLQPEQNGGGGSILSPSHRGCAVWLVYKQISPGHICITLHNKYVFREREEMK
ncbi:hypothetical protein AVEN_195418-1 [Araneus ventricosus]|uniref:Uncharacterized protein n=1 Tax=Araneus ventricosus TaxID=182803 RepID=A0A4Y2K5E5_ARAVE|nr:hypothetical protein AVEN_195418-1 [Araneus ventricosus]